MIFPCYHSGSNFTSLPWLFTTSSQNILSINDIILLFNRPLSSRSSGIPFPYLLLCPFQACAVQCEAILQQVSPRYSHQLLSLLLSSVVVHCNSASPTSSPLASISEIGGSIFNNAGPFTSTLKLQKYFHHIRQGGSSWTSGPGRCILKQRRSFFKHFVAAEIFSPHRTGGQQLVIRTREMHWCVKRPEQGRNMGANVAQSIKKSIWIGVFYWPSTIMQE